MSGPVVYGRQVNDGRFYWYCPDCKAYGYDPRLSFVYVAGRQHKAVVHYV